LRTRTECEFLAILFYHKGQANASYFRRFCGIFFRFFRILFSFMKIPLLKSKRSFLFCKKATLPWRGRRAWQGSSVLLF